MKPCIQLAALLIAVSLTKTSLSFAQGRAALIPVTEFTKRYECQGFSMLPPKGDNWFIGPSDNPAELGAPLCDVLFVKILGGISKPEEAHTIFVLGRIDQVNVGFQTSEEF